MVKFGVKSHKYVAKLINELYKSNSFDITIDKKMIDLEFYFNGLDKNKFPFPKCSPLITKLCFLLVKHEKFDFIKELLKFKLIKEAPIILYNILELASKHNKYQLAKLILDNKIVNKKLPHGVAYAFRLAAISGNIEIIKLFRKYVSYGSMIEQDGITAVTHSILYDKPKIIYELTTDDNVVKNLNARENIGLKYAAENGHYKILRYLLKFPNVVKDISADNNVAFSEAANKGRKKCIIELLKHPEVIKNIHSKKGLYYFGDITALEAAKLNKHYDVAEIISAVEVLDYFAEQLQKGLEYQYKHFFIENINKYKKLLHPDIIDAIYKLHPSKLFRKYLQTPKDMQNKMLSHFYNGDPNNILPKPDIKTDKITGKVKLIL